MARMILHARQVLDERRHARQGPEVGLVAVRAWTREQRVGDLLGLLGRQPGLSACRPLAGQRRAPALCPRILPSVGDLPGHAQAPRHFRRGNLFGEQFARLLAALFHRGMVPCLRHPRIMQNN